MNGCFFQKSETFIYAFVSNHKRFHPICLATQSVDLEQFSFAQEDMYNTYTPRFSLRWFQKKFLGIDAKAESVLRQRKARLLHAHFGSTGVHALALKKRLRIPLVTTFYGYDISQLARLKPWRRLYRRLFRGGDMFLVEGPYMKSRLIQLGCSEEKIQIQRIAIPLGQMTFRVRRAKKKGENVILIFGGRFIEKKGLLHALEAVKLLRQDYGNFEFRIIGDGVLKNKIVKFIEQNRMASYVKLLGFLPYEQYLQEMQKADIFVHPSVTAADGDSEGGAPTTILEAQMMGIPVLSTYHADIPNVVVPGESALLSPERDSDGLRQNLARLLEGQDQWERMGRAGHDFINTHHNIDKEITELENKYDSLLRSVE